MLDEFIKQVDMKVEIRVFEHESFVGEMHPWNTFHKPGESLLVDGIFCV